MSELSEQMLRSVAAKLERWKAEVEEEGRQRVAMIEAETSVEVATLLAEARARHPSGRRSRLCPVAAHSAHTRRV